MTPLHLLSTNCYSFRGVLAAVSRWSNHPQASKTFAQGALNACVPCSCSFPGGLKERPAKLEHAKDPTSVLRRAVYGMLPKNKLRKVRLVRV